MEAINGHILPESLLNLIQSGKTNPCKNLTKFNLLIDSINSKLPVEYSFNEKFYEFMEVEPMVSQHQVEEYIARLIDRQLRESGKPKAVYWAVRRKEDGVFIGTIGLLNLQAERRHTEWGFGVNPNFLTEEVMESLFEIVEEYASNIRQDVIFKGIKWK